MRCGMREGTNEYEVIDIQPRKSSYLEFTQIAQEEDSSRPKRLCRIRPPGFCMISLIDR